MMMRRAALLERSIDQVPQSPQALDLGRHLLYCRGTSTDMGAVCHP